MENLTEYLGRRIALTNQPRLGACGLTTTVYFKYHNETRSISIEMPNHSTTESLVGNMGLPVIVSYYLRYGWEIIKLILRAVKSVFYLTLPLTILTIILSIIQGLVLGAWYHGKSVNHPALFMNNMMTVKTYEWFKEPGGQNPLRIPRAPYHIQQLHNPLEWTKELDLVRPRDWNTDNVGVLASFGNLRRRRPRSERYMNWHHWIYLSANEQPLNETWNADPWDKAFLDLLEHRDKHEFWGRSNFHYITCPGNFLCDIWSVSAPALIHLTNEPIRRNATQKRSMKPILDPVSVRIFELPLKKAVIPGIFPSQFEQMRSITASNSTYWETRDKYSNFDQVRGQALKVLKKMEDKYPSTYGRLVWLEDKWVNLWGSDDVTLVAMSRHGSFIAAASSTYFGGRIWKNVQNWWKSREKSQTKEDGSAPQLTTDKAADDPVARQLQKVLDSLSEEDKEKFGKTRRGEILLNRIQNGLENDDWNSREDLMSDIEDALRVKGDGKVVRG